MMDLIGAWKSTVEALNRLMGRYWGTQTREQDTLETQVERAASKEQHALDEGDLDTANRWRNERIRLHHEIASKRG